MPVIADGVTLTDVTTHRYTVFDADGSSPACEYDYLLDQWGEERRGITIHSTSDLGLDTNKKYRISIEETDGK